VGAAVAVAATACNSSDDAALTTEPPVTIMSAPSTAAPVSSSQPTVLPTGPPTTENRWCGVARQLEATDNFLDSEVVTNPAAVESGITAWIADLIAAQPLAPDEIQAEIQTTIDVVTSMNEAFATVDYQVIDVDFGAIEGLDIEMPAASAAIEAYNLAACGIVSDDEPAGDPGGFDPNAGTVRDQAIARFVEQGFTPDEADCLVDQIDLTPTDDGGASVAPADAFAACGITAERLLELGG
jgi:hypothetical protein